MRRYSRKGRDGTIFYYADFSLEGKRHRVSLGPHKKVADTLTKDIELKLMRNQLQIPEKKRVNINEWISEYLIYSQKEKAQTTLRSDLQRITYFKNYLQEKRITILSQINIKLLNHYKVFLAQRSSKKTVNNYLTLIKAMLRFATDNGMIPENPAAKLRVYKNIPKRHPRVLTPQEIEKVLSESPPLMRNAILILLMTGLRSGEFVNLQTSQIDLDQEIIRVECREGFHTKNYQPRTIAFLPGLKEILLEQTGRGLYLFDNGENKPLFRGDTLYARMKKIYKKCGIKDTNVHSLRHTYGTYLIMNGVDVPTVQKLMGHKKIETTMQYCHIPADHIRESLAKVDFRVPDLCHI